MLLLLFSQCKPKLKIVEIPVLIDDVRHYETVIEVRFFEREKDSIDILPKTLDKDTTDLRQSINKNFIYSVMCREMWVEGKLYFEISRDSSNRFLQIRTLRGFDQTCTEMVSKEIERILRMTPIIDMPAEINAFVLQMKVELK